MSKWTDASLTFSHLSRWGFDVRYPFFRCPPAKERLNTHQYHSPSAGGSFSPLLWCLDDGILPFFHHNPKTRLRSSARTNPFGSFASHIMTTLPHFSSSIMIPASPLGTKSEEILGGCRQTPPNHPHLTVYMERPFAKNASRFLSFLLLPSCDSGQSQYFSPSLSLLPSDFYSPGS